jgi:hypothetical protein
MLLKHEMKMNKPHKPLRIKGCVAGHKLLQWLDFLAEVSHEFLRWKKDYFACQKISEMVG